MCSDIHFDVPTRSRPSRVRRRVGIVVAALTAGSFALAAPALAASLSAGSSADTGNGTTGGLDVSAVASKVDPAIVDVNTTLANGAAAGTGMIIRSSGEVLTNNHVINGATSTSASPSCATNPAR